MKKGVQFTLEVASLTLPLQLAVVEGVAALQGSADGLHGSEGQGLHLGSNVLLHTLGLSFLLEIL